MSYLGGNRHLARPRWEGPLEASKPGHCFTRSLSWTRLRGGSAQLCLKMVSGVLFRGHALYLPTGTWILCFPAAWGSCVQDPAVESVEWPDPSILSSLIATKTVYLPECLKLHYSEIIWKKEKKKNNNSSFPRMTYLRCLFLSIYNLLSPKVNFQD